MTMSGQCLCGQYSYTIDAEPMMTAVCHCKSCQRQSGSAFSTNVGVPEAAIQGEGTLTAFEETAESGNMVHRHFCATCGSPVYSTLSASPGLAFVKAGTLDDTSALAPQVNIWCKSAQDWVTMDESLPRFDANPPAA
jgi:hypothetical protein